jgi:alkylation response protein AidB-like acyl-CoA dehydrogenase
MVGRAPMAEGADWLLVRGEGGGAALLPATALACRPAVGLDLTVPEHEVEIVGATLAVALDAAAWAALAEDAMLLRAALILGAAEHCLELAVAHVTNRRQFGRPLTAFQAMRHLLARQKLALEGIRGALTRGAEAGAALVARQAAFLAAAALGPQIAEAAIHAHGGMGFTWDVPVHRHLRRIRSLEAQGEAARLREAVAAALIEGN